MCVIVRLDTCSLIEICYDLYQKSKLPFYHCFHHLQQISHLNSHGTKLEVFRGASLVILQLMESRRHVFVAKNASSSNKR